MASTEKGTPYTYTYYVAASTNFEMSENDRLPSPRPVQVDTPRLYFLHTFIL